jgi:predicted RNase H-like nuclease (RuvC/YqgF family)
MKHIAAFAFLAILSAMPCLAQSADSETLQAILAELRSMHNDVRLSATSQILLTELQLQQSTVDKARQHRDDLQNQVTQLQANQKNMAAQLANLDANSTTPADAQQARQLQQTKDTIKAQSAAQKTQEDQRTNDLLDAESALRKAQDTLADIQSQLDTVVKKLQPPTGQP